MGLFTLVEKKNHSRWLFWAPTTFTTTDMREEFSHVVVSKGRAGDTCAFPSNSEGKITSLLGFGYEMGPDRWLQDDEIAPYLEECVEALAAGQKPFPPKKFWA